MNERKGMEIVMNAENAKGINLSGNKWELES